MVLKETDTEPPEAPPFSLHLEGWGVSMGGVCALTDSQFMGPEGLQ